MTPQTLFVQRACLAAAALAFAAGAAAQSDARSTPTSPAVAPASATPGNNYPAERNAYNWGGGNYSLIPYANNGYVGINLGRSDWSAPCAAGFACDDRGNAVSIYTGGFFNPYFGAEIGYVHFGHMDRGGGRTKAHGLNLSLVGRIPMGRVNLYGKVGTLYGRTDSDVSPASGLAGGKTSGWETSYGVGVGFDLAPNSSIVLEWNRYDLNFVGSGRRDVDMTSIGYVHRF
jgi:OOP family OmpA-OmpF porin